MNLSKEQLNKFDRDGYLIIPNWINENQTCELKERGDYLLKQLDLNKHPRTIFRTTTDQVNNLDYFLGSGDQINYFFEENAFNLEGQLIVAPERAINKIGHGLHLLDECYKKLTLSEKTHSIARSLKFQEPLIVQSMLILKQPKIGGEVNKHRDNTFVYTQPLSTLGFWLALEDCTANNGCLSFVPGSHKDNLNSKRWIKTTDEKGNIKMQFVGEDKKIYDDKEFINAEVKKGSLILINGEVVHMSTRNHSEQSRYAYTFHIIEGKNTFYLQTNWLQLKNGFQPLYKKMLSN